MNENDILEMSNTLKDKYDKLENKEQEIKIKLQEITKLLCVSYGCARLLDELSDQVELPESMDYLVGALRSQLSNILFENDLFSTEIFTDR